MTYAREALSIVAVALLVGAGEVRGQQQGGGAGGAYAGAPYLGVIRNEVLYGDVWERPQLSKRDRSLVTVAVTQAQYQADELRGHLGRALDNGVTQEELSELITHVTFYSGWPTGSNASRVAAEVFEARGLPLPTPITSMDPAPSGATQVRDAYPAAPYLGELLNTVLFGDVWERPQLSKRDRSLITIAVAQALYVTDQLRSHIGRGLDNGLTQEEIAEVITHVTFYSGFPTGVNASRTAVEVYQSRGLPLPRP